MFTVHLGCGQSRGWVGLSVAFSFGRRRAALQAKNIAAAFPP